MGFKDYISKKYSEVFFKKYGDRITQVQGRVLSVKITEKTILFIFNKLSVDVLIKPERSKNITVCKYKAKKWFKKPEFMQLSQGHAVIITGIKGKKGKENSENISIMNVINMTTKKELIPVNQKLKKVQQRQFIK